MRAHDQLLHHVILVALEARADRNRRRDHPLLVDHKPVELATALALLAPPAGGPALARLFHAAGLELGPTLEALQARDLLAQGGVLDAQRGYLLQQLENQPLEVFRPKTLNL